MNWDSILDFFAQVGNWALPIFVFFTMFNVGLAQDMRDIASYFKKWKFHLRVVLANFVGGPIIAYLLIQLFSLDASMAIGLLIFSMTAGAPFMIKLVKFSDNDVALGASLMLVLVLVSVVYVPIVLPMLSEDTQVSAWQLFINLFRQLVLPILFGLLLDRFASDFSDAIQPWVAKIGNIALWVVIIGTLVGNVEGIMAIAGNGAILAGILFIIIITVLGYFVAGKNDEDHLQEVGAIGTGQRNTAASMLIAANNFPQSPEIFLIITIANMLGIIFHLVLAKLMDKGVLEENI